MKKTWNLSKQTVSFLRQWCVLAVLASVFFSNSAFSAKGNWVVLGDSISAGYGIPLGEGWVSLLQAKLNAKGHSIEVFNESISGDTSAGGLARLSGILDRVKPTKIIIELGGNDGLRGLSPKAMQRNFSDMVLMCKERNIDVVLLGMKIPPNYGSKYSALFDAAFTNVAKDYQVSLLPFFMEDVAGHNALMQPDGVHPTAEAQNILLENAWPYLKPLVEPSVKPRI